VFGAVASLMVLLLVGVPDAQAAVGDAAALTIKPDAVAPASERFSRVWHFGRTTGDLERIIAFYHDLLGLELRGARNQPLPFMTNAALDEFVAAPAGAEFRAVHLPIPGASNIADPAESISLEAFEYRGIERHGVQPALSDTGVSNLRFIVRDLDGAIAAAKRAKVAFVTAGRAPLSVPAPVGETGGTSATGAAGTARAVMLRDPDGYPVELMQLQPAAPSIAASNSRVLGATMVVVVTDIDSALRFYTGLIGAGTQASAISPWRSDDGVERLRGVKRTEHRSAVLSLPGSTLRLELLQFRGIEQNAYKPSFQDIGHAHIAFYTRDVDGALAQLRALGGSTVSRSGTFTRFNPSLRGFYTRDPDGFFLEVIERRTAVDDRVLANEKDGTNWPSYGRTFSESRFSPLTQIDASNVTRLGLAWSLDLDVSNSITAPLAMDGVVYLAAGYSIVHAVDATTGKLLWRVDTHAARLAGARLRSGWGIRGLALWNDKVIVGTQDGRLVALDRATGAERWSAQTTNPNEGLFISGPPRVFKGKVIIGNGGADFAAVRGYVTAYDADTGKQLWRFYVVPGQPGKQDHAASDEVMDRAAKTWTGDWWKYGGGGTVWNAMTYDPELDRVYIGTGNGGPWNWKIRSPGGGDNLFLASVVALDANTGRYVWHYQNTPGDSWDYNSSQDMTLATLMIDGRARKVILHAPKNGFFYVIDRETGKLIFAEKLGRVTWAEGVDLATGRPIETPDARYRSGTVALYPGFQGGHHWLPQSYSPITGLVYVPYLEHGATYSAEGVTAENYQPTPFTGSNTAMGRADPKVRVTEPSRSVLKAWDPLARRVVWEISTPGVSNGGTIATAGNLVFQGLPDGYLHAYAADSGRDVWKFFAGVAVTGVPITFSVGDKQYVVITSGPLNGAGGGFGAESAQWGWQARVHPRRLLAFTLDGHAQLPPTPPPARAVPLAAPEFRVDASLAGQGARVYSRCGICHGGGLVSGGIAPDLRASGVPLSKESFDQVVGQGALVDRGMPGFPELGANDLEALRHYIRSVANAALAGPATK
jgi:quinohemoprotein ethanol dehydrogenase